MMISSDELKPNFCLDCRSRLPEPSYGKILNAIHEVFKLHPIGFKLAWNQDCHYIVCPCGCIYIWQYDYTNFNSGIWHRRHVLPLFDDNFVIDVTSDQIEKHFRNHKAITLNLLHPEKKMSLEEFKRKWLDKD